MNQAKALKYLKSNANIFLTGSAGTGKTFLLNKFIEYLRRKKTKVGITASTGIAATHLEGRTIHSWSGIGVKSNLTDKEIEKLLKVDELREKIKKTKVLIIDEISMLDAARVDLVDEICKVARKSFLPFGGIRIIMCGDFFQLPPVDPKNKNPILAYDSKAWRNSNIKICYLDKQYRQNDSEFINILNSIRNNKADRIVLNKLKKRLYKAIGLDFIDPTKLYTHNVDVDAINDYELSKISGDEFNYEMMSYGSAELVKSLKKNCLAPEVLSLKIGAVVIFVKNNFNQGYVNGTLGKVIGFDENDYPVVEIKSGDEIIVTPTSWNIEEDEEIIASIRQIPLRLAWAITVHKSQGMSLDAAEIDLSKSFEYGMGYVALSRVRTLNGIKLMGINEMALKVNPRAVAKDVEFKQLSLK